jgi:hypothetical protein
MTERQQLGRGSEMMYDSVRTSLISDEEDDDAAMSERASPASALNTADTFHQLQSFFMPQTTADDTQRMNITAAGASGAAHTNMHLTHDHSHNQPRRSKLVTCTSGRSSAVDKREATAEHRTKRALAAGKTRVGLLLGAASWSCDGHETARARLLSDDLFTSANHKFGLMLQMCEGQCCRLMGHSPLAAASDATQPTIKRDMQLEDTAASLLLRDGEAAAAGDDRDGDTCKREARGEKRARAG